MDNEKLKSRLVELKKELNRLIRLQKLVSKTGRPTKLAKVILDLKIAIDKLEK
jgi:ribosomal protein L29